MQLSDVRNNRITALALPNEHAAYFEIAKEGRWDVLIPILLIDVELKQFEFFNPITCGEDEGQTIHWLAAKDRQWDFVFEVVRNINPDNMNPLARAGSDAGVSLVWLAAKASKWDLVRFILCNTQDVHVNCYPSFCEGESLLWVFALSHQYHLLHLSLKLFTGLDFSLVLTSGFYSGLSLMHYLILVDRWDLVEMVVQSTVIWDPNCSPSSGAYNGMTPLWLVANSERWKCLELILLNKLECRVDASYRNESVLAKVASCYRFELIELMLTLHPNFLKLALIHLKGDSPLIPCAAFVKSHLFVSLMSLFPRLDLNASKNNEFERGKTVFWWLARTGQWFLIESIMGSDLPIHINASPEMGPEKGLTPLYFLFCERGEVKEREQIAFWMLMKGADIPQRLPLQQRKWLASVRNYLRQMLMNAYKFEIQQLSDSSIFSADKVARDLLVNLPMVNPNNHSLLTHLIQMIHYHFTK